MKKARSVFYLAAEGEGQILNRVRAAKIARGLEMDTKVPFVWRGKHP